LVDRAVGYRCRPSAHAGKPLTAGLLSLAGRLRGLRESAGITQQRLAARAYVCIATVRKIETGPVVQAGYFIVQALLAATGTSRVRGADDQSRQ
jgi:predicted Abi (CAAX) family protease